MSTVPDHQELEPATAAMLHAPPGAPVPGDRVLNRELQWLAFNERVLYQALDTRMPLLERVRFLGIFTSNLDEFFMKRVGGLRRQVLAGVGSAEGGPAHTIELIRERVLPFIEIQSSCYEDELIPALRDIGVELVPYDALVAGEREEIADWFRRHLFPILTPLAIDPGHRFPFISNLSVSLAVMLRRPGEAEPAFARVKVPEVVEQWRRVGDGTRLVHVLDIVRNNLEHLFPGMEILNAMPFRITRNADVEGDHEDADDLLVQIQAQLRERRFAPVVRLEIPRDGPRELRQFLCEELEVSDPDVYPEGSLITPSSLEQIASLDIPEHRFTPWIPVVPRRLDDREKDIFTVIREGDVLVHQPYESFDASVERFIEEAAADPDVLCIKQTLYRTSGKSPFVHELIRAAERGVQVAVLVELRARFDEARNIQWAAKLEDAGVHVAYGVVGLKTHSKTALVVRREGDGVRCYAHIGTGNYNSNTALLYDDVGLLTCDPVITEDIVNLFNSVTGRSRHAAYRKLLVAPQTMKGRFMALIEREAEFARVGRPARIVAKMNQLQDRDVINALYDASRAGVSIDLIIRGFCTLIPGAPGISDNIRVISIIGRFLEHSRIFHFSGGEEDPLDGIFLIGSADWMYRNLHNRVEAVCPIDEPSQRARLWEILDICMHDRSQAWEMRPDGGYELRSAEGLDPEAPESIGTHKSLMRLAEHRAR